MFSINEYGTIFDGLRIVGFVDDMCLSGMDFVAFNAYLNAAAEAYEMLVEVASDHIYQDNTRIIDILKKAGWKHNATT